MPRYFANTSTGNFRTLTILMIASCRESWKLIWGRFALFLALTQVAQHISLSIDTSSSFSKGNNEISRLTSFYNGTFRDCSLLGIATVCQTFESIKNSSFIAYVKITE